MSQLAWMDCCDGSYEFILSRILRCFRKLRYSFGRGLKIFLAFGESHCVVFGCWMSLLLLRVVDDCRGNNDSNDESSFLMQPASLS